MATSSALTTRHRIDEDFIANVPPAQVMKGEASAPSVSTLTPSFAFGNKRLVTNCRMACGPAVDYSSASPWPPRWDSGGQAPQPPWTDQPCPVPRPPGCIPGRPVAEMLRLLFDAPFPTNLPRRPRPRIGGFRSTSCCSRTTCFCWCWRWRCRRGFLLLRGLGCRQRRWRQASTTNP